MLRMRFRVGTWTWAFDYSGRDLQILWSQQWLAGQAWRSALGVYANFSVAKGQDSKAWVRRDTAHLLEATRDFAKEVREYGGFVHSDYAYRMPADRTWLKRRTTDFPFRKLRARIQTGPATLFVDAVDSEDGRGKCIERIDLRGLSTFAVTELASIAIRQSPAESGWPTILPSLTEFLESLGGGYIEISHGYGD
jgi:hypothetical protein